MFFQYKLKKEYTLYYYVFVCFNFESIFFIFFYFCHYICLKCLLIANSVIETYLQFRKRHVKYSNKNKNSTALMLSRNNYYQYKTRH